MLPLEPYDLNGFAGGPTPDNKHTKYPKYNHKIDVLFLCFLNFHFFFFLVLVGEVKVIAKCCCQ